MLLFDSWYDMYRGVICLVAVADGSVSRGGRCILLYCVIFSCSSATTSFLNPLKALDHDISADCY